MIIQRFQSGLHPAARGDVPVIVTGPAFKYCAKADAGQRPFWRMTAKFCAEFRAAITSLSGESRLESVMMVSELLLVERIVEAQWVTHSSVLPRDRWLVSIEELANQTPVDYHGVDDLAGDFLELLDGMCGNEYYANLFSAHGDADLEPQLIVV